MKILLSLSLFVILFCGFSFAGENEDRKLSKLDFIYAAKELPSKPALELEGRNLYAFAISFFIPGGGQTFLGHHLKGAAITLGFYGTAVASIIAHNNFTGREDRIEVLTQEYKKASDFDEANFIWNEIKTEENNRKYDNQRRKIFGFTAAAIWVYNIVDILFFSEDQGEDIFSLIDENLNIINEAAYSGIALKINLP